MEPRHLKSAIESILFVSNKPLTVQELTHHLQAETGEVRAALTQLADEKKDSGVVVLDNNGHFQLATNATNSTAVKNFLNADLREKLTDATVEVLAIIAYRQPISKAEIEAIRGVNSQYSLRHLLMRGMIEKIANPNDSRSTYYQTTTEFLQQLGIVSVGDLPEFEKLAAEIKLPETPQLATEAAQEATAPQEEEELPVHAVFSESPDADPEAAAETPQTIILVTEEPAMHIPRTSQAAGPGLSAKDSEPAEEKIHEDADDEKDEEEDEQNKNLPQ